jgi:hypothetical protein
MTAHKGGVDKLVSNVFGFQNVSAAGETRNACTRPPHLRLHLRSRLLLLLLTPHPPPSPRSTSLSPSHFSHHISRQVSSHQKKYCCGVAPGQVCSLRSCWVTCSVFAKLRFLLPLLLRAKHPDVTLTCTFAASAALSSSMVVSGCVPPPCMLLGAGAALISPRFRLSRCVTRRAARRFTRPVPGRVVRRADRRVIRRFPRRLTRPAPGFR